MNELMKSNKTYIIAFIVLTALNLFITFSYSTAPMGVKAVNFLFAFLMSLTVYLFFSFIFIGASRLSASVMQGLSASSKKDPEIADTFLIANLLYIFLFLIYLKHDIDYLGDASATVSIESFLFYIYPFFTSLIGGLLSGSLVLFSPYESRDIIKVGRLISIGLVLIYFAYRFFVL